MSPRHDACLPALGTTLGDSRVFDFFLGSRKSVVYYKSLLVRTGLKLFYTSHVLSARDLGADLHVCSPSLLAVFVVLVSSSSLACCTTSFEVLCVSMGDSTPCRGGMPPNTGFSRSTTLPQPVRQLYGPPMTEEFSRIWSTAERPVPLGPITFRDSPPLSRNVEPPSPRPLSARERISKSLAGRLRRHRTIARRMAIIQSLASALRDAVTEANSTLSEDCLRMEQALLKFDRNSPVSTLNTGGPSVMRSENGSFPVISSPQ